MKLSRRGWRGAAGALHGAAVTFTPERPMFGMFKSQTALDLNPRNALVVSLVYCMGADGEMDQEEIAHLFSVLGPRATRENLDACVKYARSTPADTFLSAVAATLNPAQRLCIVLNMIDSAMADGQAEEGEQALVRKFQAAFDLPDAALEAHFRTLVAKNDRSVLDR
jgi:uncharacterized tellurite resistance protein B-like protein